MRCRKFYFDRGQVEIPAEHVHELDADGRQLRVVKHTDYTAEKVRTLASKAKSQRLNAELNGTRTVSAFSLQPSAFSAAPEAREILNDLLEKYASDGELQLVAVRKHLPDVLTTLAPKRRYGAPRRREVPPISQHGNVNAIIGKFGGADQLRTAVNQLQSLLYIA